MAAGLNLTATVAGGPTAEPLIYAALTNGTPIGSSRSAASWHSTQRDAHGAAARRFGLIADPHLMQVLNTPS